MVCFNKDRFPNSLIRAQLSETNCATTAISERENSDHRIYAGFMFPYGVGYIS